MDTTEKFELPAGCSLEFTGPAGKPIKITSIDELKKLAAEAAERRSTEKIDEAVKKKHEELAKVVEAVYTVMFDGKCVCKCKDIYQQFAFFVNDILLPNTTPGYKCIIEPMVRGTYDLEGELIGSSNAGVRLVFCPIEDYNNYWTDRKTSSRRCLASKNDLKKIGDAIAKDAPIPRVSASSVVPLAKLLLSKNSSQSEVTVAINTFLDFIASKYGVMLAEEIVGTDTVQRVADVLNLVIKFVNKKFNKNIKTIKDTDKFGRRINACISILKILKAIKQSKKTEKK